MVTVADVEVDKRLLLSADSKTVLSIADIYPGDRVTLEQIRAAALNVRRFFSLKRVAVDVKHGVSGVALILRLIPAQKISSVRFADIQGRPISWLELRDFDGKVFGADIQQRILRSARDLVRRLAPGKRKFSLQKKKSGDDPGHVVIQIAVNPAPVRKKLLLTNCPQDLAKQTEDEFYDEKKLQAVFDAWLQARRKSGNWAARLTTTTSSEGSHVLLRCFGSGLDRQYAFSIAGNRYLNAGEIRFVLQPDPGVAFQKIDLSGKQELLVEKYQREGFFDAKVKIYLENKDGHTKVHIDINEGVLRTIESITIDGLPEKEKQLLYSLLPLTVSKLQQLTSDRSRIVTQKRLSETRRIAENFLLDQGWLEGKITWFDLRKSGRNFYLGMTISTGPRYRFGPATGVEKLPGIIPEPPEAGTLFTREAWEEWRKDVQNRLGAFGYLDANLLLETEIDRNSYFVLPRIRGNAGSTYVVGRIYLQGVPGGDRSTLRRILPMTSGDIAADTLLVEVRRRFYLLGVFASVQAEWFRLDKQTRTADLLIRLRRKPAGEIGIGLGINTAEGVDTMLHLVHRNLLGSMRSIEVNGRLQYGYDAIFLNPALDQPLRAELQASLHERWLFGTPLRGRLIGRWEFDFTQSDFDFSVLEGVVGADYGEIAKTLHYFFYSIQKVEKFNILNRELNPDRLERIGKMVYDYSRSTLDDRFDPREGGYLSAEGALSLPWFGSMYKYVRLQVGGSYLYQVLPQLTFVISAKGGALIPLEKRDYFPRTEKFQLGGVGSVRGYQSEVIGPSSSAGLPVGSFVNVGGMRSFAYQAEIRIPFASEFDLALFQDTGIAWKTEQTNDMGSGASIGAGLLYHSPIGPIRLDFGNKLLVNEIDDTSFALHFYVGALF